MALLDKAKFLQQDDYEYKDVHLKALGGEVRIKALSIRDQLSFEKEAADKNQDESNLMFNLILKCCIDEKGELLFNEEDLEAIKDKSADVIVHLFKEILKINHINQDEVDGLAKN